MGLRKSEFDSMATVHEIQCSFSFPSLSLSLSLGITPLFLSKIYSSLSNPLLSFFVFFHFYSHLFLFLFLLRKLVWLRDSRGKFEPFLPFISFEILFLSFFSYHHCYRFHCFSVYLCIYLSSIILLSFLSHDYIYLYPSQPCALFSFLMSEWCDCSFLMNREWT